MGVQKKQPFGNFMPKRNDIQKILIIGSGPIVIGQACEFDYSGTQACKALREEGYKVILVNSNPATIMTDPEFADVTYIEPLTVDALEKIILKESDELDKGFVQDFECAMNDDLNTPKAISILFEIVKKINLENDNLTKRRLVTTLKKLANIIGLLSEKPELFFQYGSGVDTQMIEEMILKRNLARKDKDFDKADEIRDELKSLGIILDDKADGTKWKKV